jgi:hypothetical protein
MEDESNIRMLRDVQLEPKDGKLLITFFFEDGDSWSELFTAKQAQEVAQSLLKAALSLGSESNN